MRRVRFLFFLLCRKENEEERDTERMHTCQSSCVCVQATNMSVNERQQQQRKFIVFTTNVDACQTC
jgi:hypothetical protein